jgi:hypothetical protein
MAVSAPPSLDELRLRVQRMQGTSVSRSLPVLDALEGLVQLHTGGVYGVDSPGLGMVLLAAASRAGEWAAIVGAPEFGYEAAAAFGVDLRRTLAVPDPGESWASVTAGLVDVATVVLLRPPNLVRDSQAARLRSRLVQKDAALIVWGEWPRCTQRLVVRESAWSGLGEGYGRLLGRRVEVAITGSGRPERTAALWLPDEDQQVRRTGLPAVTPILAPQAQAG